MYKNQTHRNKVDSLIGIVCATLFDRLLGVYRAVSQTSSQSLRHFNSTSWYHYITFK